MLNALQNNSATSFLSMIDVTKTVRILFIIIFGLLGSIIFRRIVSTSFLKLGGRTSVEKRKQRLDTFQMLVDNIISTIVFGIVILLVLSELSVNIVPIITGAGILGLAISFGAQTLVKDVIAGFFIIAENQYNVGDTINIEGTEGIVLKLNLRTTIIKDKRNNIVYIPNSEIKKVTVINRKSTIIV